MTPEEIASAIEVKIKGAQDSVSALKTEFENAQKSNVSKDEVKTIQDALKTAQDALDAAKTEAEATKQSLIELATKVEKANKETTHRHSSFADQLEKCLLENADKLKEFKTSKDAKSWISMEIKSAGNMTLSHYTGGTALTDSLDPGLTPIATRRPFIIQLANTQATSSNTIRYVEKKNRDGAVTGVAEGNAKPLIDFDLVEVSVSVVKKAAHIKVSKEMMDDIPFIMGEIRGELKTLVDLEVDGDLFSGAGTGTDLRGVTDFATAFDAGTFAGVVVNAGRTDVLRIAIAQIETALFEPNYILLHPNDVASMELEKSSTGEYVMPPFRSLNGMQVKGLAVITNTGVTEGTYVVGDFTKMNVKVREGFGVSVGLDGNDFTNNMVTIVGETRLVSYFKSNYAGAFVTGTFATDIAAISTP